jgi:hypothetical protein
LQWKETRSKVEKFDEKENGNNHSPVGKQT